MSDGDVPDRWWGDESPITTERRRNGVVGPAPGAPDAAVDGLPGSDAEDAWPARDHLSGVDSGDAWPAPDPSPPRHARPRDPDPSRSPGPALGAWGDPGAGPAAAGDLPHPAPTLAPGAEAPGPPDAGWPGGTADHPGSSRRTGARGSGLSPSDPLPAPQGDPSAPRQWFVPPPEELPPFEDEQPADPRPALPVDDGVPPAPVLHRPARALDRPAPARPRPERADRHRLAVVYDIEGPRVRLGIAWFAGALAATVLSPLTAALAFAVVAGFAGRQIVRAWGSVPWQADIGAGIAAAPVLAAAFGTPVAVGAAVLGLLVAVGAAGAPDGARLPGGAGRVAAAGILALALVPALGGASMVLVRSHSAIAAVVLLAVASAYEMADYIVGSGAGTPVEGPLAGITTATLLALPLSIVLVEPYDTGGVALLAFTAAACPLGQIVASAALPGAGAHAPALRRIDTLLVLAPIWAAAAAAF